DAGCVHPAAAPRRVAEDAGALNHSGAHPAPARHLMIATDLRLKPAAFRDPRKGLKRRPVSLQRAQVNEIDVDAVGATPVMAERAGHAVGEIVTLEDRSLYRGEYRRTVAAGEGPRQCDPGSVSRPRGARLRNRFLATTFERSHARSHW